MPRLLIWLRAWIRWCRPRRGRFFLLRQLVAAVVTTPVFILASASLLAYARLRGPVRVDTEFGDGLKMTCHLPDAVQMCVFLFGVWEPDISAFVRQRLSVGDTFVDIGSHVGYYSLIASRQIGRAGRVVAVEASPTIFQQLQTNLAMNNTVNVRAWNIAAAAQAGSIKVHRGPVWNLGWTTTLAGSGLPLECEVPALPVHEMLTADELRNVRLIKVDVEGTERELFEGLLKIVEARPDAEIIMELSPRWWKEFSMTIEAALQPFLNAGYHVYHINNDYGPWRYLWPDVTCPPQRVREPIKSWIGQVDVILSRVDAEVLAKISPNSTTPSP